MVCSPFKDLTRIQAVEDQFNYGRQRPIFFFSTVKPFETFSQAKSTHAHIGLGGSGSRDKVFKTNEYDRKRSVANIGARLNRLCCLVVYFMVDNVIQSSRCGSESNYAAGNVK